MVVVGPGGEFFIELARERGAYDNPSQKLSAVSAFIAGIVASYPFGVIAGVIVGFAGGVWLDAVLKRNAPPPGGATAISPNSVAIIAPAKPAPQSKAIIAGDKTDVVQFVGPPPVRPYIRLEHTADGQLILTEKAMVASAIVFDDQPASPIMDKPMMLVVTMHDIRNWTLAVERYPFPPSGYDFAIVGREGSTLKIRASCSPGIFATRLRSIITIYFNSDSAL